MLCPLLLLLLLAHCSISAATFPQDSTSRMHWVGPKLRLALRQAKRSLVSTPTKLYNPRKAWEPATRNKAVEASEADKISGNYGNSGNFGNHNQLEKIGEEAEQLAQMIKSLQQAVEANQMMEPKLKRPKIDGRIRILKVSILCIPSPFRCLYPMYSITF